MRVYTYAGLLLLKFTWHSIIISNLRFRGGEGGVRVLGFRVQRLKFESLGFRA